MPQLATAADTKYQLQLPKVSFRVIEDDKSLSAPAGVHSEQFRHFGYNDFSDFERPDFYIRYIEPIESELAKQVEYDMDEQDQEWLDAVNLERKKEQSGPIPYEVFEIIMDKLEKEWFALSRRIPQPASHMPVEDSKCAICDDGEGENSNAIVFCDGCNLAVHQDCYGVPYIPEGQWLCRKCTVSPGNPVSCLFCPNEGGAFKQTNTGHWSHLLCAMWIPELSMGNAVYMEPIEGVELIPKSRWKLVCSLCRERVGACVQCENRSCFTAFHVTCARQMGLITAMKTMQDGTQTRAFCEKHLPDELRKEDVLAPSDAESEYAASSPASPRKRANGKAGGGPVMKKARGGSAHQKAAAVLQLPSPVVTTKTARAHAKSYRPGPPIVPNIIVQSVIDYVAKIHIRKRTGLVERICRYWSLKREATRGAPLLKRLHLEPWTANSDPKEQTDAEKQLKLQFIAMVRNDLEKVRMLAEQVRKREKKKLAQAQVIKDVVDSFLFRGDGRLSLTLQKISAMDRQGMFLNPVSRQEVPDYYNVITEPMCWLAIEEKIEKSAYTCVADFKRDIGLTLTNAMTYNLPESPFYRAAKRIQANAQPLLDELDNLDVGSDLLPLPNAAEEADEEAEAEYELEKQKDLVGDLEASLLHLHSLIQPPLDSRTGTKDILQSLFKFELEPPREPTPPPPPSPPKKVYRKETAAERKAKWEEREARHKERMAMREATGRLAVRTAADSAAIANDVEDEQVHGTAEAAALELQQPPKKRGRKSAAALAAEAGANIEPAASSGPSSRRGGPIDDEAIAAARRQRGVVGLEAVAVLTDRERRQRERELDIVTDTVDGKDQFARFNVGWVLPEGSKRRRGGDATAEGVATPQVSRKGKERARASSSAVHADETPTTAKSSALSSALGSSLSSGMTSRHSGQPSATEGTPRKENGRFFKKIQPPTARKGTGAAPNVKDTPSSPLSSMSSGQSLSSAGEAPEDANETLAEPLGEETADSPVKGSAARSDDVEGTEHGVEVQTTDRPAKLTDAEKREREVARNEKRRQQRAEEKAAKERLNQQRAEAKSAKEKQSRQSAEAEAEEEQETEQLVGEAQEERETGALAGIRPPRLTDAERRRREIARNEKRRQQRAEEKAAREAATEVTAAAHKDGKADNAKAKVAAHGEAAAATAAQSLSRSKRKANQVDDEEDRGSARTPVRAKKRPRRSARAEEIYAGDETDDITPMVSDEDVTGTDGSSPVKRKSGPPDSSSNANGGVDSGEDIEEDPFPPGTLVWAHQRAYPYFAAEIIDHINDEHTPQSVIDLQPDGAEKHWLIRFFDEWASYAWISRKNLDMLGEDGSIDEMYLAGKRRGRPGISFKNSSKQAVQKGFDQAMAVKVDTDEDE